MAKAKLPDVIQKRVDELHDLAALRAELGVMEKRHEVEQAAIERLKAENDGLMAAARQFGVARKIMLTRIAELGAALGEVDFVVRTGVLPGSQNPPSYAVHLTKDEVIKWCGDAAAAALEESN